MIAAASSAALIRSFVWFFISEAPRSHRALYVSTPPAQAFLHFGVNVAKWPFSVASRGFVGHAKSRKIDARSKPKEPKPKGEPDGDDPIGCPGNSAGSDGAQTPPCCRGPWRPSPRSGRTCQRSNLRRQGHGHGAGPTHRPSRNPPSPRRSWKGETHCPYARRVPHSAGPRLRSPRVAASMVSLAASMVPRPEA